MFHSTSITANYPLPAHRSRLASIALWGVQLVLAGMFLLAGGSKLAGAAAMVALFDAVGVGQWFRYVTGGIEVVSAVALLVPSLAAFGAVALVATMIGAIATHLFVIGGSPAVPVLLLVGSLVIAWARRDQLSRVVSSVSLRG
jgi:putative oxidoreductase